MVTLNQATVVAMEGVRNNVSNAVTDVAIAAANAFTNISTHPKVNNFNPDDFAPSLASLPGKDRSGQSDYLSQFLGQKSDRGQGGWGMGA